MTNSDYLIKAAIKKVTEKLNEILVDKIEEATNIAQDAPVILKKEFDSLKESIIEEASRMEKAEKIQENESANTYQDSKIKKALNEIEDINKQIDLFNKTTNNQMK
jgi:F0F1-type ATP synthase membrane subunit b/b'